MTEVSHACEHHRQTVFVGGLDDFVVAHRATWLNDGCDTGLCRCVNAVAEGEKCVGCHHRALDHQTFICRFERRYFCAVHATHLARTDSDRCLVFAENDRVRLDVLDDGPGKQHVFELFRRWCFFGNDLEIVGGDPAEVAALNEQAA